MAKDAPMSTDQGVSDAELAAEAKRKAAAHGATGGGDHGKLTPGQRAFRDGAIMAALHAGEKATEVAREFGITPRSVRRVAAQFKGSHTVLQDPPMEIVNRMIRTYELAMRRYAALADEQRDRMPAVATAAIKGEMEAFERLLGVLVATGKLPSNLELFRSEDEVSRIGSLMVEKVMALERGELSATEVADFFFGLVAPDVQKVRELPAADASAPADAEVVPGGDA